MIRKMIRNEIVGTLDECVLDGDVHAQPGVILRRYTLTMAFVESVDNEGTTCEFCMLHPVDANTYLTPYDEDRVCVDHCRYCTAYVIDSGCDTDESYPVHTEILQKAV